MVLHSYIRTKQITNSTYMKKQILLHVLTYITTFTCFWFTENHIKIVKRIKIILTHAKSTAVCLYETAFFAQYPG
jgi:hypothetical protein